MGQMAKTRRKTRYDKLEGRLAFLEKRRDKSESDFWSKTVMELANLSVVVLVAGQFLEPVIRWWALYLGVGFYIVAIVIAVALRR